MTADERAEAAEVEALGEVVEYLTEWKNTCRQVGIPFTLHDAVRFADEGGVFDRLLARRLAEARAEALREAADAIQALHPGEVKNSVTFLRARAAAEQAQP